MYWYYANLLPSVYSFNVEIENIGRGNLFIIFVVSNIYILNILYEKHFLCCICCYFYDELS